jgi:hypothetical protein
VSRLTDWDQEMSAEYFTCGEGGRVSWMGQEWELWSRLHGGSFRRGWTLETWHHRPDLADLVPLPMAPRYVLSRLEVTMAELDAIAATRAAPVTPRWEARLGGPGRLCLDDAELTAAEATAIMEGRDPMTVLLPRLVARALSREELMRA